MSYFKSIFKRWMGAPDHRITYEPPPTGGYQRGEDDPPQDGVSGSSPPPSYHTGPRPEGQIAPHELKMQQEEVLKQAQDRAEQEELMIAIGMSRSLQEERLRMVMALLPLTVFSFLHPLSSNPSHS